MDLASKQGLQAQQGEDNFTTKSYLLGFYAPHTWKTGKKSTLKTAQGTPRTASINGRWYSSA